MRLAAFTGVVLVAWPLTCVAAGGHERVSWTLIATVVRVFRVCEARGSSEAALAVAGSAAGAGPRSGLEAADATSVNARAGLWLPEPPRDGHQVSVDRLS